MDLNNISLRIQNLRVKNPTEAKEGKHVFFDEVIGHIEDMLIDESFSSIQKQFLDAYWREFDDCEENKHVYMEIFKNYTNIIESYINEYLKERIRGFKMSMFINELERRKDELDGEVFEVLYTISDIKAFKQMFLDYRKVQLNGELDLTSVFNVLPLHSNFN